MEHEYKRKSLEHFNKGPVLLGMVMTLLRDRKASINIGSTYSKACDIKRRTPQGDRSSLYIFIICLQILLLKIELGGGGIIVGRVCTNLQGQTVNSVNEVFADDLTAVFRMSVEAVRCTLKVPKREIFVTELIILSHPIWIGDLRTKAKNRFLSIVRLLSAILFFYRRLSMR